MFALFMNTQLLPPLPIAGFGDPVLGLVPQTPMAPLPSFFLRPDSGLRNVTSLGLSLSPMVVLYLFPQADRPVPGFTDKQARADWPPQLGHLRSAQRPQPHMVS